MGLLNNIKVEVVCIIFGLFGIILTFSEPQLGGDITSTTITAYFAFKKNDDNEINK